MPRGRGAKKGHKGQRRSFSTPEQRKEAWEKKQKEKEWRAARGVGSDSDEEDEDEGTSADFKPPCLVERSESEEESSEEEEKPKGVSHLIDIENPNRVQVKTKKVTDIDVSSAKPELSRREREAIEKERAKMNYERLHAEGKTDEAQADLARLAIIRKQRAEAAKKRQEEKEERDRKAAASKKK